MAGPGVRLKGLHSFRRRGRWMHYYRARGVRVPLVHGVEPDDPRLIAAWAAARQEHAPPQRGTVAEAFGAYLESGEFARLAAATRANRGAVLRRLIREQGDRPVASIRPQHITAALARVAPSTARTNRAHLSAAFRFCRRLGMIERDPAAAAELAPLSKTEGHAPWTADDIERFVARWPRGTPQRLALDLALYTGQRRADLCRLGPPMIRGEVLSVRQSKTGAVAHVPMTRELRAAVEPFGGRMVWILNRAGAPFDAAGLGRWFRLAADAAGVSKSLHGLRKAFCVYHAERGASAHEIAAMSGHVTLSEVGRYTRAADRLRIVQAMAAAG